MKAAEKTQMVNNSNLTKTGSLTSIEMTRFDIKKSEQDKRLYRGIQLDNGMKVLLVSDPTTDKSAACLSCEIGHMSDPEKLPGINLS